MQKSEKKVIVELNPELIRIIHKIGFMDETIPEFIEKVVEHILSCQEWWEMRDAE